MGRAAMLGIVVVVVAALALDSTPLALAACAAGAALLYGLDLLRGGWRARRPGREGT